MTKSPFDIPLVTLGSSEPKAKKTTRISCPYPVKVKVWRKYNGNKMNGKCYVCKERLGFTEVEIGHNKPFSKGGKWTVANCRPICRGCNRSMGKTTIEAFKKTHFSRVKPKPKKNKPKRPKPPKQPSVFSGFELPKNHPLRQPLRF